MRAVTVSNSEIKESSASRTGYKPADALGVTISRNVPQVRTTTQRSRKVMTGSEVGTKISKRLRLDVGDHVGSITGSDRAVGGGAYSGHVRGNQVCSSPSVPNSIRADDGGGGVSVRRGTGSPGIFAAANYLRLFFIPPLHAPWPMANTPRRMGRVNRVHCYYCHRRNLRHLANAGQTAHSRFGGRFGRVQSEIEQHS